MKRIFFTFLISLTFLNLFAPVLNRDFIKEQKASRARAIEAQVYLMMCCIKFIEVSWNNKKSWNENKFRYYMYGPTNDYGGYQFLKGTWIVWSKRYFGYVAEMTPNNQDWVARNVILDWIQKGYSPAQMASLWNCNHPDWKGRRKVVDGKVIYDVERHVRKFNRIYNQLK